MVEMYAGKGQVFEPAGPVGFRLRARNVHTYRLRVTLQG